MTQEDMLREYVKRLGTLSKTEWLIAKMLACGLPHKHIAILRNHSINSTGRFARRIYTKLEINSVVQLVHIALAVGLVDNMVGIPPFQIAEMLQEDNAKTS